MIWCCRKASSIMRPVIKRLAQICATYPVIVTARQATGACGCAFAFTDTAGADGQIISLNSANKSIITVQRVITANTTLMLKYYFMNIS